MCIELAVVTGISPSAWAAEGERAIYTAFDLLQSKGGSAPDDDGGPQMSG